MDTHADERILPVVRRVLQLAREFTSILDAPLEDKLGLNLKELFVLRAIQEGEMRPGRIAAQMKLPAPTVTRILDRLVSLRLVERSVDQNDLRRFRLELTPEGRQRREQSLYTIRALLGERFGHVDVELLERLNADLAELEVQLAQPPDVLL
ncbi:DNA-binding MarR family transcriptional regulator [Deinobacterium chartae]|uniref:DNA-binding MarR family transcriptional regulator n=1 Tax=Deinobacterium chartae TaxID=521158 RepID=A0A841HWQ9_9DEIO|nr:MarR family transcriptional regulator [Deinobacterium chartae]MBB6097827.1 DNA-binding MarR family transcriptional regulator [Deinobacterium chartae]